MDPQVDDLARKAMQVAAKKQSRREAFNDFWTLVHAAPPMESMDLVAHATVPYLDEPWYC